jgi:pimeloyl-ACP methyl ester carboxylesterase
LIGVNKTLVDGFYQGPGVTAAQILQGRGYIADEFYVETTSGYVLRLTRGRNPLIENGSLPSKDPILFVHGVLGSANNFLLNSFDAQPKDFTNMSLGSVGLDTLNAKFADEPSAKSLPLFASNFGHEIWLLDRRGTPGSQQLLGDTKSIKAEPSVSNNSVFGSVLDYARNLFSATLFAKQVVFTFDKKFWNYSLDEQAFVDFPETIDFILKKSSPASSKVSVVAHSAGGAITLMALSLYPEELTNKISSCILWAPAYATSDDNPSFMLTFPPLVRIEESISFPMPPPFSTNPLQAALMLICSPPPTWTTLCEGVMDLILGQSGQQEPVKPQLLGSLLFAASSHELAQLGQPVRYPNHTMHRFDYRERNQAAYGQPTPPAYDLSVLRNFNSISFYIGVNDALVTPADVQQTRKQLRGKQ